MTDKKNMDDFDDLLDGVVLDSSTKSQSNDTELLKKIEELELKNSTLMSQLDIAIQASTGDAGKPLLVSIDDVIENPDHPNSRQEINQEFEDWLTNNIKEQKASDPESDGIQDPISVHWSKEHEKWIINKGHTRHKCGRRAGLLQVPVIIQDKSTDWNQIIENIIRDGLSTKDLVNFISSKVNSGISQKEVAQSLSRDKGWVSKHMALVNPPTFVQSVWDNKYATEFAVLYTLVTIYKANPQLVEEEVNKVIAKKQSVSKLDLLDIKKIIDGNKGSDLEPEDENDNEEDNEQGGEAEESNKKSKPKFRLAVELDGEAAYLLLQAPSHDGNLVLELQNESVIEAPIDQVIIKGMVDVTLL